MNEVLFRIINDSLKCSWLDWLLPVFSDKDYLVIPGCAAVIVMLYAGPRRRRLGVVAVILAVALADFGSEKVLKGVFDVRRPYGVLEGVHVYRGERWMDYDPAWYPLDARQTHAFPSSHAANVAAAVVVLFYLRRRTLWATVPLAALVGMSRVYTGNHWPADVLGGYVWGGLCGFTLAGLGSAALRACDRRWPEPPGEPIPRERKALFWLLGPWTLVNFAFVCVSPFCLAGDEAQYWDWSRRLALGYYSKPPMIAYLMALFEGAGGSHEWALRSGAVFLSSATLALVYGLTVRIARSERAALLAVAAILAIPSSWAGSVIMTPDALVAFFWALALYAFHRAVNGENRMWWLVGLALGLGLLSKYTIALLGLTLLAYLALVDRGRLRTRGPYLAAAIAALCMSGVLYWNDAHDWVSFRHTAAIGAVAHRTWGSSAAGVVRYLGGQALVVSPLLFGFFLWATWDCARRFRRDRDAAFLALSFAGVFGFYLVVSWFHKSEVNWPICAYIAAAPALGWAWWRHTPARWSRHALGVAIALGCLVGLAARSTDLVYLLSAPPSADAREDRINFLGLALKPGIDPTNELRGPRELGAAVSEYVRGDSETGPFLFSDRYQLTAQLAFYTPGRPRTYCMNPGDRRFNQYDLWGGWQDLVGRDGIFVTGGGLLRAMAFLDAMVKWGAFDRAEVLETVPVYRGSVLIKTYTISRLYNYSGYDWTPAHGTY